MNDFWWIVALICAFSLATSDALTKNLLKSCNEYLVAWSRLFYFVPLGFLILYVTPVPEIGDDFYWSVALALPLEMLALVLYVKALKISPLSLTLPFLSLTPVFLLFIPFLILGEVISLWGAVGILLIALGSYALNLQDVRFGLLKPFAAIGREKGSLFMIAVAFIYSMTATLGKSAILASSPIFFGAVYFLLLFTVFTPLMIYKNRYTYRENLLPVLKQSFWPGMFFSLMMITHVLAISMTQVAYMIAVKRISLLIGVAYGYFLFREENIRERLMGAAFMFSGFLMIVLI